MEDLSTSREPDHGPGGIVTALYQLELRRLADLQRQHDDLAARIQHQLRRVAEAAKLLSRAS